MSTLKLDAEVRELTGRKVRQLRRSGLVPVIVYGQSMEPVTLQVNARSLEYALHHGGSSQLVQVDVKGGDSHNVLLRDIQRDPVSRSLMHADFYAVNMSEKQIVSVPVHGLGSPAALASGLMMRQALDQVEIEALPADIPAVIEVDVTPLDLENTITVAELPVIEGVVYVTPVDETVFTMVASRAAVEEEEEMLEGEMVEPEVVGEESEEGEEEEE